MARLLLVDDEPAIQHAFRKAIRDPEIEVSVAGSAAEAFARFDEHSPDVIVLDVHLPDSSGLETFHALRSRDRRVPIIMITGHGTTGLAIEAMKEGAYDYLLKPLELSELRELIERAIRSSRQMRVPATMAELEPAKGDSLVGRCPQMQEVYKAVGRVARQDVSVLILGESGTGKELVARAIYQHSGRSDQPFVAINCGAIPESLLESELFGHEKGAFTGAERRRIGKFEQANGGTLFLDEVGELPMPAQVKILRILQERTFERVGGNETIPTDVRVIAATNADLEAMVEEGTLRKDLFFRLNVFAISLPPLRERGNDLEYLAEHYFQQYRQEMACTATAISSSAMAVLKSYSWPGNVRELQSVIRQSLLHARGDVVLKEDLPTLLRERGPEKSAENGWESFVRERISAGSQTIYDESLKRMEGEVLVRVLRHTNGNQLQAAKILGITRGSLRSKIRNLGITIHREIGSDTQHPDM